MESVHYRVTFFTISANFAGSFVSDTLTIKQQVSIGSGVRVVWYRELSYDQREGATLRARYEPVLRRFNLLRLVIERGCGNNKVRYDDVAIAGVPLARSEGWFSALNISGKRFYPWCLYSFAESLRRLFTSDERRKFLESSHFCSIWVILLSKIH